MLQKCWHTVINEKNHKIEIHHNYFSGKKQVYLNGISIFKSSLIDVSNLIHFNIEDSCLKALIEPLGTSYNYKLFLNDELLELEKKGDVNSSLPFFFWLSVIILCFIPIISYEGIIGFAIAVVGIKKSYTKCLDTTLSINTQLKHCITIVLFCYLFFIIYYKLVTVITNYLFGKLF